MAAKAALKAPEPARAGKSATQRQSFAAARARTNAGNRATLQALQPPASVHEALSSPGSPLPPLLRARAENFFGNDLGHVRLHGDQAAARAAAQSRAHALTVGPHIILSRQRRDLARAESLETLTHELAHTLQPSAGHELAARFESPGSPAERMVFGIPHPAVQRTGICRDRDPRVDSLIEVIESYQETPDPAELAHQLFLAAPGVDFDQPENRDAIGPLLDSQFGDGMAALVFRRLQSPANTPAPAQAPAPADPRNLSGLQLVTELQSVHEWLSNHLSQSAERTRMSQRGIALEQALVVYYGREFYRRYGTNLPLPAGMSPALLLGAGLVNGFIAGIRSNLEPATSAALNAELNDPVNKLAFEVGGIAGLIQGAAEDLVSNIEGIFELVGMLAWHAPILAGHSLADVRDLWDSVTDPQGHAARQAAERQFYSDILQGFAQLAAEIANDPSILLSHGDALGQIAGSEVARWFTGTFMAMSPFDKGRAVGRVEGMVVMEIALLFLGPEEWIARGVSATAQAMKATRLARELLAMVEHIPALARILSAGREAGQVAREAGTGVRVATEVAEETAQATRVASEVAGETAEAARVTEAAPVQLSSVSPPAEPPGFSGGGPGGGGGQRNLPGATAEQVGTEVRVTIHPEPGSPTVTKRPSSARPAPEPLHEPIPEPVPAEAEILEPHGDPEDLEMLSGQRDMAGDYRQSAEELEPGLTETDTPGRYDYREVEGDLMGFAAEEFPDLPMGEWMPENTRFAEGQVSRGRFPRRNPNFPNRRAFTVPDRFHPGTATHPPVSLEAKNYLLNGREVGESEEMIDRFTMNVVSQARDRAAHVPPGTEQWIVIDVRGQEVSAATRQTVIERLTDLSGGTLHPDRIRFIPQD